MHVFAVYLLFAFHSAKVYDPTPLYRVWSPDLIPGIQRVTGFGQVWHMPLLFLLAGWSSSPGRGSGPVFPPGRERSLPTMTHGARESK